ncbi:nectin-3-like isoform X4 [Sceloporus undulatus]|uniref:nectin-3-like isoform X4 n=1 Tax=Sceloporus undulatus TaxID=8520 RepID=UPI001C4B0871|nr:nectin-3-like isoform X4 [Sceloporus undulatus]
MAGSEEEEAAGAAALAESCRLRRRRLGRPAMPALLLSLGLVLSRGCCGALAGPVVDPHVRAVWGKNVTLKCIIDINETLTQITWEKIQGKSAPTIAVHHPEYGFSVQGEYQGRVSLKNTSLTDASIILENVTFSDSGEYVCKAATFPLGNSQSTTSVTVLDSPEVTVTGYDGNWYIGRENVLLRCNADANPLPMEFTWSRTLKLPVNILQFRLDGSWPEGLQSLNNTLHFNSPLTYNYTGTYVCKVANTLGQRSDQKTIYILDPPTTTTSPPTIPWLPSTDGITGLATQPKVRLFPTSPWPAMQEDNWGTVIGSAVGGALFLILVCVLVGIIWYKRRRTFRGDYFAKNYIPPSDMQKESQIDSLQVEDVDSYPDSVKKEIKPPVNSLITKDYLGESEKTDWNKVDTINRYQDRYERPMDYYEGGTLGMKYLGDECYDENEDDLVSHVDGSVISRKEWYV